MKPRDFFARRRRREDHLQRGGALFQQADTDAAPTLLTSTGFGDIEHLVLSNGKLFGAVNHPTSTYAFVFTTDLAGGPLTELFHTADPRYGASDAPQFAVTDDAVFALDAAADSPLQLFRFARVGKDQTGTLIADVPAFGYGLSVDGAIAFAASDEAMMRIESPMPNSKR